MSCFIIEKLSSYLGAEVVTTSIDEEELVVVTPVVRCFIVGLLFFIFDMIGDTN